jgi:hypothetical protein
MTDNGLPCIGLLEATPAILRGLMTELTEEDARWKPAPDRFSIAEVLAHLSHSEGQCYRMRLDRFVAETRPEFEPDDAQMYLELYKDADPEDAFGHFEEQRENNVEYLRGLSAGAGNRVALHSAAWVWRPRGASGFGPRASRHLIHELRERGASLHWLSTAFGQTLLPLAVFLLTLTVAAWFLQREVHRRRPSETCGRIS